ncbi:predicted protein [Nematostella vectensis]|nr:predicted protein [Nematostella vectensis]|eukprot:XP_001622874.1 predicted protein [Nematostella vectensis]
MILVLLACLVAAAVSSKVDFKDCSGGKGEGEIVELDISPCPTQPCTLHKGTTVSVNITFVPHVTLDSGKAIVHGVIAGIPVPFPLPNADVCKNSGLKCPLEPGTKYVYQSSLEVKTMYPSLKLVVRWEIQDNKNKDVLCFEIPTQIA